jgi:Recombinase
MRGGRRGSAERRAEIALANSRAADSRGYELSPVIEELRAAGSRSLREIAAGLTERRIPTPRGRRCWHPVQVKRVLTHIRWHRSNLEWQESLAAARGE